MQYLLMCCFDEERWAKMPEAQKGQIMREYGEVIQGIVKSGHFRAGAQLQPTSTSTTLREKNGKLITMDKKVKAAGGKLRLCSIRSDIKEVFKITRLDKLFTIVDNRDKAVEGF